MRFTTCFRLLLTAALTLLAFGCSNVKSPSPSPTGSIIKQSSPEKKAIPHEICGHPEEKTGLAPVLETCLKPVQKPAPDSAPPAPEPVRQPNYYEIGKASFYANMFQSRKTASGERFDQNAKTAAHKHLPFGTRVKVTNKKNKKSVIVTINDRGPFVKGRIIDLSRSAFSSIGNTRDGLLNVGIEIIDQNDSGLKDYGPISRN